MDFKHISVLLDETIDGLDIKPDGIYVDGTLGGGGHSYEILRRLSPKGRLIGIDQDGEALKAAGERLKKFENQITLVRSNYCEIDKVLKELNVEKVDGILLDIGVSSYQLDNLERGFSYKKDGPLDLRLNPKAGRPASQILKELSREDLENILLENSDEPYADILAKNIYSFIRSGMEVETTRQLYKIIDKTLNFIEDKNRKDIVNKTAARVFQALRIEVNQEFEVLNEFVEKLPKILKPGGKVAILTFHSGEDRIVKKTFKEMKNSGVYEDVCRNVIRPTKEECHRNSRAKSTKMRWAIKAK